MCIYKAHNVNKQAESEGPAVARGVDDGAVKWKAIKEKKPFEPHFKSVISRGKSNFKK